MSSDDEVRANWRRIEAWLAANERSLLTTLLPPATPQQIKDAEAAIGVSFPPELLASLAAHDGQEPHAYEMFAGWALLPLVHVVVVWKELVAMAKRLELPAFDEPDHVRTEGPVRPRAWDPLWIPVADDGQGNRLMLDMDPPRGGTLGQVIRFRREANFHSVEAADFGAWLSQVADWFERGELVPDDDDDDDDDEDEDGDTSS